MKLQKLFTYAIVGYGIYYIFFRNRVKTAPVKTAENFKDQPRNLTIEDGVYEFEFVGSSALRVDPNTGLNVPCGLPGDPFNSRGVEGQFATVGVAPTTFYAMFRVKSNATINPGDRIQVDLQSGDLSALDGNIMRVLQHGSDTCNADGKAVGMNNMIVVDFPMVLEGSSDYLHPQKSGRGTFKIVNEL